MAQKEFQIMIFENRETKEERKIEIQCPMNVMAPFEAMKKELGSKKSEMEKWVLKKAFIEKRSA